MLCESQSKKSTAHSSGAPEFTPWFLCGVRVAQSLIFCVIFCGSLFVHLSSLFFFIYSLYCISFFDFLLLIIPCGIIFILSLNCQPKYLLIWLILCQRFFMLIIGILQWILYLYYHYYAWFLPLIYKPPLIIISLLYEICQ